MKSRVTEFVQKISRSKLVNWGTSKTYVYLVVAITLLVLGLGEWIVRSFIVPIPSTTPYEVNLIYTGNNKNVVVGDSQIYRAFIVNDDYLNLGLNGTTIPMMEIIFEQYFKYREPGKVIVEVAPQLLSQDYLNRTTQGYEQYFNQNYPFPIKIYILEPGIGSWIKDISSIDDFSRLAENRKEGEADKTAEGNWKDLSYQNRLIRTRNRIRRQEPVIWAAQDEIETYGDIIEFLKGRGADVCMFRPPVDETYLDLTEGNPLFAESLDIFRKISIANEVRYIDFQDLGYDFSLDKFINQDHITPQTSAEIAPLVYRVCFGE